MVERLQRIVESRGFQRAVLGAILAGAVIVGLETSPTLVARHGGLLYALDSLVIVIFGIEALMKIGAHGRRPWRYFANPWNVFDFAILVVCLIPAEAHYAAVLRLARVLRALRLVGSLPKLQLLVSALLRSIPSMGYIAVLLFLHFYIYAVVGVFLFRANDPVHFGDLGTAFLSLFRVITLEDWTDIMYIQMYGSDAYPPLVTLGGDPVPQARPIVGAVYFISFVLFGTMIMLNLFIGVVVNSMAEAQQDADGAASSSSRSLDEEIRELENAMSDVQTRLRALRSRAEGQASPSPVEGSAR